MLFILNYNSRKVGKEVIMKKNSNLRYILENFEIDAGNFEWLNCIETFFGTEKAEEFGIKQISEDDYINLIS